jgi:DnaJ homolog subfamily C member 25
MKGGIRQRRRCRLKVMVEVVQALVVVVVMMSMLLIVQAEDSTNTTTSSTTSDGTSTSSSTDGEDYNVIKPQKKREKRVIDDDFDVTNENWGMYYDPMNIFCGSYDCYKILGFDYESYNKVKPTTKEITQRYRRLSREWHPDKSKHKQAKEKFVKIARAYEVLTSIDTRKEYDTLRYDQAAYVSKYGSSVLWTYAPKTDVTIVLLIVLVVANIASWYAQQHRWSMVADRLIKAAAEDWLPKDGGTEESKALRLEAIQILQEREQAAAQRTTTDESTTTTTTTTNGTKASASSITKKGKKDKGNKSEKKKTENEVLLPIIKELVNEMDDFGAGFHKPTWRDLFIVVIAKVPISVTTAIVWQVLYSIRRLQKLPLNDEEKIVLTQRAVGPILWNASATTEEDRSELVKKELWKKENLLDFLEEQEVRKLSATEQKIYYKRKKKGLLDKLE